MAKFEFDMSGADDFMEAISKFPVECPVCHKEFEISVNRTSDTVICPHCKAEIEIESE